MVKLIDIATRIMDQFFQNYPANDAFFDLEDFKYWVSVNYSSILNNKYQLERRMNKQTDGFTNIDIPAGWLYLEETIIKKDEERNDYYIELSQPIFFFDYDGAANALQGLHSVGGKHQVYRKISLNERGFRQVVPPIDAVIYYVQSATRVRMWDNPPGRRPIEGACVEAQYIPAVVGAQNDCLLSDSIAAEVAVPTLDMLFKAKNGNFIQKLDDQNPNTPVPQGNPVFKG